MISLVRGPVYFLGTESEAVAEVGSGMRTF